MTSVFWTEDKIARAAKLWQDGVPAQEIADVFGSKKNTVINMASRHRDRFPTRQPKRPAPETVAEPVEPIRHPDRVTRITLSGAEVTLPRVPLIDGHFMEGC